MQPTLIVSIKKEQPSKLTW